MPDTHEKKSLNRFKANNPTANSILTTLFLVIFVPVGVCILNIVHFQLKSNSEITTSDKRAAFEFVGLYPRGKVIKVQTHKIYVFK